MPDKKEIDALWRALDSAGVEEVRKRQAQSIYGGWKKSAVEQWLRHQETSKSGAGKVPYAKRLVDTLLNHPIIGVVVAIGVIVGGVATFKKNLCDLYTFPYLCRWDPANEEGELPAMHFHVVVSGTAEECASARCIYEYYAVGVYQVPSGSRAVYRDRVKASAGIISLKTVPSHTVLNPDQYRGNKTYLEFEIHPPASSPTILEAQAELILYNKATPSLGKIGAHLPYRARNASMTVDLSRLTFRPAVPIEARIESLGTDGVLREGGTQPMLRAWQDGSLLQLTAREVPARSSLVIRWGAGP